MIHPAVWPQQTWAENWVAVPLFRSGGWVSIYHKMAWAKAYLHDTKWHLDPSSRLATIDMGQKLGAMPFFLVTGLGPHLAQCGLHRGLPPCQVPSGSIQPFGHNRHGLKGDMQWFFTKLTKK